MTDMASTTIVFGILLTLLGLVGYAMTRTSMTALIPALFGLLLLILRAGRLTAGPTPPAPDRGRRT